MLMKRSLQAMCSDAMLVPNAMLSLQSGMRSATVGSIITKAPTSASAPVPLHVGGASSSTNAPANALETARFHSGLNTTLLH
jgi:hypothetical protein